MKKIGTIRTVAFVALLLVIAVICVLVLTINGVIPVNPPRLDVLTNAGVTRYRSFAEGWKDPVEKYAFIATRDQVAKITGLESLGKTTYFDCEELTSRNRLKSFTKGRPYWFSLKWSRVLEHYAATQGPPIWKEMVYDPTSGQCLLKEWDD